MSLWAGDYNAATVPQTWDNRASPGPVSFTNGDFVTSTVNTTTTTGDAVPASTSVNLVGPGNNTIAIPAKAAGVPDPLRTLNLDKAYRHYADLNNFPGSLFYTDGEVAQHDQIRQEEQQKAQIPGQAQAAVDAAKTLSQTQIGGGNALGAMLGASGSGAT